MQNTTITPTHASFNRSYLLREIKNMNDMGDGFTLVVRESSEHTWYQEGGGISGSDFTISYDVFLNGQFNKIGPYTMRSRYTAVSNTVDLTCGGLFLDPEELRGKHIGTFFFLRIVKWAQSWPSASVAPIELVSLQAGLTNKERRNRFYEQFGIRFKYHDSAKEEGVSTSMLVSDLTPDAVSGAWMKSVREISMSDFVGQAARINRDGKFEENRLRTSVKNLQIRLDEVNSNPLKHALRIFRYRYAHIVFWLFGAAVVVFAFWHLNFR
ncbi:MAG: hypothetical protein ABJO09_11640 [Hyphomicrobiales bacterium]